MTTTVSPQADVRTTLDQILPTSSDATAKLSLYRKGRKQSSVSSNAGAQRPWLPCPTWPRFSHFTASPYHQQT